MAYVEFYVQATNGSNLNAGSTTAASTYTAVNGNWDNTGKIYTPVDGSTPASSIAAGDYASVYLDAAAVTTYVAKIQTVAAGVNGAITMDATIFYGTGPSTATTGRSIKVGGPWVSPTAFNSTGIGNSLSVPQDTRINILAATYTRTASDTFGLRATTTLKLWIRGYNGTPGDLDSDTTNSLSKPIFSYNSTFSVAFDARPTLWSGVSFTGSRSGVLATVGTAGGGMQFSRCRFENTSSNAAAAAMNHLTIPAAFYYCYFKHPTTGTNAAVFSSSIGCLLVGCVAEGGGLAGFALSGNSSGQVLLNCSALNNTGGGITVTGTGNTVLIGYCSVTGTTVDGITVSGSTNAAIAVIGCLIANCGGIGINNTSATTTSFHRACNLFYNNSGGNESGFGQAPSLFERSDSSPGPITSSSDLTLLSTSLALNHGFPGIFENKTFTSLADCGAVQASGTVHGGNPSAMTFVQ